ncbi:MAG: GGDEF domain-containing protein, partial [Oscillospiraceae bacterium]
QEQRGVQFDKTKAIEFASEMVFEADISNNKILSCSSEFLSFDTITYDEFWDNIVKEHVHKINWEEAKKTFSRDNIEYMYWEDIKSMSKDCLYQKNSGDPYQWVSLNCITFCINGRDTIKTIFYIQNINERKEKELTAIEQSKIDCLSNLYNKKFTQDMINDYIYTSVGEEKSAFIIMDIDNFKSINDTFGHIIGDNVITDIASRVKKQFRGYDIIGRIGGDEFVVFMRDIGDMDLLEHVIKSVIKALDFSVETDGKRVDVSASVGVAIYPDNGKSYNELYKNADKALYKSKESGKNCFSFYEEEIGQNDKFSIDNLSDRLLVEFIRRFRMEQSMETKKIIGEKILQYIGKQHKVSRIYNIILDDSQKNFHTTLEWCNDGIPMRMCDKGVKPLEIVEDYIDYFNEDGVFSCRDVRQLESSYYNRLADDGVIAVLQYAVVKDGKIKFCVGFDDCREKRYWSDEAVRCLHIIKEVSEECF